MSDMKSLSLGRREFLAGMAVGAASVFIAASARAGVSPMLVGAGKRIITPNPLLPVSGGMGPTHPTREKRGDLTARAVYLRRDDVKIAVVSLDLLGFPSVLADRVRARVPRLAAENILIGSTH